MKTILSAFTMLTIIFSIRANTIESNYKEPLPTPPKIILNELFSLEKMIGEILNREATYYINGTLYQVYEPGIYTKNSYPTIIPGVMKSTEIKAYYGRNYVQADVGFHNLLNRGNNDVLQIYVYGDSQRSGDIDKNNIKINLKKWKRRESSGRLSNVTTVRKKDSFFISGIFRKEGATFGVNLIISKNASFYRNGPSGK